MGDIELKLALLLVVCNAMQSRFFPKEFGQTTCCTKKLGAFPMLSASKGGKAGIPGLICGKQAEFNGFQAASLCVSWR